jgi:hypothetical protein
MSYTNDLTNLANIAYALETGTTANSTAIIRFAAGNSTINTAINSTAIAVQSIVANGSIGTNGSVLISNGSGIYWSPAVSIVKQQFTGDGANTQFVVSGGYTSNTLQVFVNGIKYVETYDVVTTSGSNVVFTTAPANTSLIEVFGFSGLPTITTISNTSIVSQQFTANGSANSFIVSGGYTAGSLQVFVNGVKYVESSDVIATSGSTINFTTPPGSGSIIDVFGQVSFPPLTPSYLPIIGGTLSGTVNVGSNISLSTTTLNIGNSTVNSIVNSTYISTTGVLSGGTYQFGNSTVNTTINSTAISIGNNFSGNATSINTTAISIGNSTVNTVISSTSLTANASIGTNGQVLTSNGAGMYWSTIVGVNTSAQYVFANTIGFGNSTVNTTINATSIKVSNSTSNISISVPNTTQVSNGSYFLNANGAYSVVVSGGDSVVNTLTYSASLSLDSNVATSYYVAATGNPTISITGNNATETLRNVTLIFNHSGGVRSITWGGTNIKFTDNTAPVLSSVSGATDVFTFFTYDQGVTWNGALGWWSNT